MFPRLSHLITDLPLWLAHWGCRHSQLGNRAQRGEVTCPKARSRSGKPGVLSAAVGLWSSAANVLALAVVRGRRVRGPLGEVGEGRPGESADRPTSAGRVYLEETDEERGTFVPGLRKLYQKAFIHPCLLPTLGAVGFATEMCLRLCGDPGRHGPWSSLTPWPSDWNTRPNSNETHS